MTVRIHPTAIIEHDVCLGEGTAVWDNVHIRHATRIGDECIIGEKTYIAYGVKIGNRVKINAFVYICTAVTIEDGVMISAGTVFTNDRFPRATTPDLKRLRPSEPDEQTRPTGHSKIRVWQLPPADRGRVAEGLSDLAVAAQGSASDAVAALSRWVPEYRHDAMAGDSVASTGSTSSPQAGAPQVASGQPRLRLVTSEAPSNSGSGVEAA